VYTGYTSSLAEIAAHTSSFTHVSPTFYSVNYAYHSGVAYFTTCPTSGSTLNCTGNGSNNFDGSGLTTSSFTSQVHALGLKVIPAIYGGAANNGTDTGIENILNNTSGARTAFISAMVSEAVSNGYDGYNLDWEAQNVGSSYAASFVSFVQAFRAALVAQLPGAILSADAIVNNINGTYCSGNDGYLDFSALAASTLDRVIIEDYASNLDTPGDPSWSSCADGSSSLDNTLSAANPASCDYSITGMMNMMCAPNLGAASAASPSSKAVIGLEAYSTGTNPSAGAAFAALQGWGFSRVAVWPQYENASDPFLSTVSISPSGATWYGLLGTFLSE
jgi:hypothetical protein